MNSAFVKYLATLFVCLALTSLGPVSAWADSDSGESAESDSDSDNGSSSESGHGHASPSTSQPSSSPGSATNRGEQRSSRRKKSNRKTNFNRNTDKPDQDDILQHRRSNKVLPFKTILKMVRKKIRGQIIKTEFEINNGVPLYEFKYISKSGRIRELYVNARTGKIVRDKLD